MLVAGDIAGMLVRRAEDLNASGRQGAALVDAPGRTVPVKPVRFDNRELRCLGQPVGCIGRLVR
jgi:hypothetical protein